MEMAWSFFSNSYRVELFVSATQSTWNIDQFLLNQPYASTLAIMFVSLSLIALYWFLQLPSAKPFLPARSATKTFVASSFTKASFPTDITEKEESSRLSISMKRRQRRKRQKMLTDSQETNTMESSSLITSSSIGSLPPMIKSMLPFSSSLSASAIIQLWEDVFLSPESVVPSPFRILKPEEEEALFFARSTSDATRLSCQDVSESSESFLTSSSILPHSLEQSNRTRFEPTTVHFCFLVHGHRGHSRDLSYVQAVMRRLASSMMEESPSQRCIVHSVRCNEKKTDDGIVAGGTRLMEEMLHVIRESCPPRTGASSSLQKVTISLWGNSLGGLYARYALSLLSKKCTVKTAATPTFWVLDDTYSIYLNVFCTTATPHLGISGHTFVALPRRAEIGLASAMGETGKDLFRLNTILYDMATEFSYVQPLSLFQKRICYANAYGTDFPVPASTAAFLSELSTVPHYFAEDDPTIDDASLVQIATLYTSPQFTTSNTKDIATTDTTVAPSDLELAQMSMSLDSLGWKKVFVDMRKEVPHIVLPKSLIRRSSSSVGVNANVATTETKTSATISSSLWSSSTDSERSSSDEEDDAVSSREQAKMSQVGTRPSIEPIHRLKKRLCKSSPEHRVLSSKDVAAAVSSSALLVTSEAVAGKSSMPSREEDHATIHWPLGHNMIVAFSRSRWSAHMNKAGRPIVDGLAREIVQDIFAPLVDPCAVHPDPSVKLPVVNFDDA